MRYLVRGYLVLGYWSGATSDDGWNHYRLLHQNPRAMKLTAVCMTTAYRMVPVHSLVMA